MALRTWLALASLPAQRSILECRLIGSKFNRPTKTHLQPRTLVFLDVDASLRDERGWIVGPGSPLLPFCTSARSWNVGAQVPHLHCLFLVPSKVRKRFEELMCAPKRFWKSIAGQASIAGQTQVPLRTSDTQQVLHVFEVVDYVSKFLKNAPGRQETTDYWNIWPTTLSERQPKKNGMPYTKREPTLAVSRVVTLKELTLAISSGVTLKEPMLLTSNTA